MTPPSRSEGRLIWSPAFRSHKGPVEYSNGRIGGGCGGNREAVGRVVGPFLAYFFPHMIFRRAVHIRFGYAGFVGGNGSIATPYKVSPRKAAMMFLATSVATRTCASTVDAPRCGVAMTRSCASRCLRTISSLIGS